MPEWLPLLGRGVFVTQPSGFLPPLTMSGNEITDAERLLSVQGDGAAIPGGIGIWEGTMNLCTNGGFEAGTTGWSNNGVGAATLARVTSQQKFGAASLSVACPGASNFEGASFDVSSGIAGATQYTLSVWVNAPAGTTLTLTGEDRGGVTTDHNLNFTATGVWQRVFVSWTSVASTSTVRAMVFTNGKQTVTFYLDGVQLEQKPIATPYVETNGTTATRNAARVQASKSLLSTTQSAVAFRIAYGFPSTATRANPAYLFDWRDDANNLLGLWLDTANEWNAGREAAGAGSPAVSAAQTFAKDDTATVIFACDSGHVKVSVNGGAFTSVANTSIPTLAAALADLGSQAGASQLDGRILWAATFTGTLTDADAALLAALQTPSLRKTAWRPQISL